MRSLAFGGAVLGGALVIAVAVTPVNIRAQRAAGIPPTFNQDVAPILNSKCVSCHRPGQVAPMSLLSYKEARPWARAIRTKVVAKEMPPWGADPRFGHFRNARTLTQEQIDTIVAWVDRGAAEGDGAAPPPPDVGAGGWSHPSGRPPDMIVEMPFEMEIPAQGQFPWFEIYQSWPFKEDKFVEAIQVLPSNTAAAHHLTAGFKLLKPGTKIGRGPAWLGGPVLPNVLTDPDGRSIVELQAARDAQAARAPAGANDGLEGQQSSRGLPFGVQSSSFLEIYVPPMGFQQFRPGVGKRIPKESVLYWNLHYTFTGKPEKDRSRVGLWFHNEPMTVETITRTGQASFNIAAGREVLAETVTSGGGNVGARLPVIPPNDGNWAVTGIGLYQDDATIHLMWPHMHVRGKDMTYLVTYPDGHEEVLLSVPKYNFNWQLYYDLAEPKKIPAGSTLRILAHYDNSVKNRGNPAPEKEVYWSEQSWDEMFTGFYEVSIDKQDRQVQTASVADASNHP